uniref:RibD_C domain-containing protein n=1 Tax=Macrostomum lignano TaxID=282301 RepID=A0A1I8F5Y1_9PLAT
KNWGEDSSARLPIRIRTASGPAVLAGSAGQLTAELRAASGRPGRRRSALQLAGSELRGRAARLRRSRRAAERAGGQGVHRLRGGHRVGQGGLGTGEGRADKPAAQQGRAVEEAQRGLGAANAPGLVTRRPRRPVRGRRPGGGCQQHQAVGAEASGRLQRPDGQAGQQAGDGAQRGGEAAPADEAERARVQRQGEVVPEQLSGQRHRQLQRQQVGHGQRSATAPRRRGRHQAEAAKVEGDPPTMGPTMKGEGGQRRRLSLTSGDEASCVRCRVWVCLNRAVMRRRLARLGKSGRPEAQRQVARAAEATQQRLPAYLSPELAQSDRRQFLLCLAGFAGRLVRRFGARNAHSLCCVASAAGYLAGRSSPRRLTSAKVAGSPARLALDAVLLGFIVGPMVVRVALDFGGFRLVTASPASAFWLSASRPPRCRQQRQLPRWRRSHPADSDLLGAVRCPLAGRRPTCWRCSCDVAGRPQLFRHKLRPGAELAASSASSAGAGLAPSLGAVSGLLFRPGRRAAAVGHWPRPDRLVLLAAAGQAACLSLAASGFSSPPAQAPLSFFNGLARDAYPTLAALPACQLVLRLSRGRPDRRDGRLAVGVTPWPPARSAARRLRRSRAARPRSSEPASCSADLRLPGLPLAAAAPAVKLACRAGEDGWPLAVRMRIGTMSQQPPQISQQAVLMQSGQLPEKTWTRRSKGHDFNAPDGLSLEALMKSFATTGFQIGHVDTVDSPRRGTTVAGHRRNQRMLDCKFAKPREAAGAATRQWRLGGVPDPYGRARHELPIFLALHVQHDLSGLLRESIRYLVEHNLVDVLVTTGGAVGEDLSKCMTQPTISATFIAGGRAVVRPASTGSAMLVPNKNYCAFESWLCPFLDGHAG